MKINNIIKDSCFPIKNTKPLTVLYVPIRFEADIAELSSPLQEQVNTLIPYASSYLKGTYPIAQGEFTQRVHPFPISISGYESITSNYDLISLLETIDGLKFFLYPGLPGVEDLHTVGIVRENWLEIHAGAAYTRLPSLAILLR